jgi:hypothetical protein
MAMKLPLKDADPIRIYILAMSGVVVLLGAFLVFLVWTKRSYDAEIPKAMKDCEKLVSTIKELTANRAKANQEKFKPEIAVSFFYDQAREAGIPQDQIDYRPQSDRKSAGYVETPFTVNIKTPIRREQLARFLYNVETNSGLVRASDITMTIPSRADEEADEWDVRLTFAYRQAN